VVPNEPEQAEED